MLAGQRMTVGVDVGGTKLVASAVDAEARTVGLERWPEPVREYEDVLGAIPELVTRIRASVDPRPSSAWAWPRPPSWTRTAAGSGRRPISSTGATGRSLPT
jgi:hypothetical protein